MKIVLQNLENLEYAHTKGQWTPHVEAAINFTGVVSALDYAAKRGFLHVRVAMNFDDSTHDVSFPPVHMRCESVRT